MAVLSVDLAYRLWSHLGIVVLDRAHTPQTSNPLHSGLTRPAMPLLAGPDGLASTEFPISCEIIPSFSPGLDENLCPAPACR